MPSFSTLEPYWEQLGGVSFSGCNVVKVKNRRTGEFRIAWHTPRASRWRLSAAMGETLADVMLGVARDDSRRGSSMLTTLRHRLYIYGREVIPSRWKNHRKHMEEIKMKKAMAVLPTYGMF